MKTKSKIQSITLDKKSFCKLSNLIPLSLALQSILLPLVMIGTASSIKAEEFKPRQLIAQSCRNINIRTNGNSRTFRRGARGSTCGYRFNFQSDGNLVFSNSSGQVLWATGTEGRGEILRLQPDGNLVIYGGGKALWATNTDGNPGAFLAIQSDGNLVVYRNDGQQALWASNTDGGQFRTRNAAGEWSGGSQTASQPSQSSNSNWANQFNNFVARNNGYRIGDPGGAYPGQCVSLVKQWGAYISRGYGFWQGDYPAPAFDAYQRGNKTIVNHDSNTSTISDWRQLQSGDIVIMRGYPSHTGIASGKKTGSQYEMFDQNSPEGSASALQMYNGSNFIGAIRYN